MYQPLEQPRQALSSSNAMAQTVSTTLFTAEQDRTQTPPFPSPEPRLIAPSTIYNNGNRQHGYRAAPSPPRCICTETHTHTSAEARVHSHTHSDPELRIQDAMSFVQYVMDTLPEKTFSQCEKPAAPVPEPLSSSTFLLEDDEANYDGDNEDGGGDDDDGDDEDDQDDRASVSSGEELIYDINEVPSDAFETRRPRIHGLRYRSRIGSRTNQIAMSRYDGPSRHRREDYIPFTSPTSSRPTYDLEMRRIWQSGDAPRPGLMRSVTTSLQPLIRNIRQGATRLITRRSAPEVIAAEASLTERSDSASLPRGSTSEATQTSKSKVKKQ
mgnify:CR=1 FL=1